MKTFSTPALFLTLNPSDLTHPLVGRFGGIEPEVWRSMTSRERGVFVAKNPYVLNTNGWQMLYSCDVNRSCF